MDTVTELIKTINTTPFRTIALIIGLLALSVGHGLRIRAVIDVDKINKAYAKTVGTVFLVLGILLFMPDIIKKPRMDDPFLPYYIVSVIVVAMFSGAILKFFGGQQQLTAVKGFFLIIAAAVSFVVLWRGVVVYFYVTGVSSADGSAAPLGFHSPGGNYLPYLVLLSAGVALIVWLIYANTKQPENSANRITIFQYFAVLCVYLGACRVVWEIVDLIGKKVLLSQ